MNYLPRPRWIRPGKVALIVALVCVGVRGDDADDYRRLARMPREHRAALAEKLAEFDRLDDRERATVRRLDRELAKREPVDRARLDGLIRRYHLWTTGLPEEQRTALRKAESPTARLELIEQIRQKTGPQNTQSLRVTGIRTGQFGLQSPYRMAFLLQVWMKLTDDQRKKLADLHGEPLLSALRTEANRLKIKQPARPAEVDKVHEPKVEADRLLSRVAGIPPKRAGEPDAEAAEKKPRRSANAYAEFLYFDDPATRPRPVTPANLARFESACPPWFLAMTDTLNAEDARAYLTAIYRILYEFPAEVPEKAPAPTTGTPTPPRPATKPQAAPTPPF